MKVTTGQIRQVLEIDAARQDGIGDEVQELIHRLTSGGVAGKSDDPRIAQAKRLWDRGFGRELGIGSFDAYLATIPEIPKTLKSEDPDFQLLVLVDPRLGVLKSCELIGIHFKENGWTDENVVPADERHAIPNTPFWVRFHDGRKNRNRRPSDCRKECVGKVYAGTAMVGIMAYLHHPGVVKEGEHVLDLPGSMHREDADGCASLMVWRGRARLVVGGVGDALPAYGSGSFRRE